MKILKYALVVLVLVIAGAVAYVSTLDLNQYKGQIETQVHKATGRDLAINGKLGFAISLVPTLSASDVTLSNAPWARNPQMLKVGQFKARVSILPLLSHRIDIGQIVLENADLDLETDKSGHGNWQFQPAEAAKASAPSTGPAIAGFSVGEVRIKDTHLVYLDGRTGKQSSLSISSLSLSAPNESSPLQVDGKLKFNDLPVSIQGSVGSLAAMRANQTWPVDLKGDVGPAKLSVSGKLDQPLSGKGVDVKASINVASLADLKDLTGSALPAVSPVAISATLKAPDSTHAELSDVSIKLGKSDLSGNLSVDRSGSRPRIKGQFTSQELDVTPFLGGKEKKEKSKRLFSDAPLPVNALKTADADIRLSIAKLDDGDMVINKVQVPLNLTDGRLSIAPASAEIAGGTLAMKVVLNSARATPDLDAAIDGKHIVLGQLPQLKEKSRLQGGSTDLHIDGRGAGKSVAAIMGSLNGSLLVQVGPGKIPNSGVNLAGADLLLETFGKLNPLSSKEPTSDLECAVVNFKIKDGLAKTDKGIAIQTSKMNLVGSGGINLKTEQVDLGVRPYARQGVGLNLGSIAGAARIGGTLADPHPVIDAANALKAGVSAGAAVATFGLSALAQGMFDKNTEDPHPCDTALGKAPAPSTTEAKQKTETAPKTGVTDKLKGALDSLFGH